MLFFYAILVVVGVCFSADWSDLATKPSQVQVDGKLFYEISSAKELAWFSKQVASGKTAINAVLKNDISCSFFDVLIEPDDLLLKHKVSVKTALIPGFQFGTVKMAVVPAERNDVPEIVFFKQFEIGL